MNQPQLIQHLFSTGNKRFTEFEDQKLKELVGQFGARRWRRIAQLMPGRSARQCRDRYSNYLSPDFYNDKWTDDEDKLLIEKHKEFGSQWVKLATFFPGKNANNIKNRWNYKVSRIIRQQEKDQVSQPDQPKPFLPSIVQSSPQQSTQSTVPHQILIPPEVILQNDDPSRYQQEPTHSFLFPPISQLLNGKSIHSLFQ